MKFFSGLIDYFKALPTTIWGAITAAAVSIFSVLQYAATGFSSWIRDIVTQLVNYFPVDPDLIEWNNLAQHFFEAWGIRTLLDNFLLLFSIWIALRATRLLFVPIKALVELL